MKAKGCKRLCYEISRIARFFSRCENQSILFYYSVMVLKANYVGLETYPCQIFRFWKLVTTTLQYMNVLSIEVCGVCNEGAVH